MKLSTELSNFLNNFASRNNNVQIKRKPKNKCACVESQKGVRLCLANDMRTHVLHTGDIFNNN